MNDAKSPRQRVHQPMRPVQKHKQIRDLSRTGFYGPLHLHQEPIRGNPDDIQPGPDGLAMEEVPVPDDVADVRDRYRGGRFRPAGEGPA